MKNCLLSGSDISNLVRLVTTLSTSTFEKSGFKVKSKFIPLPMASLASPPILYWASESAIVKSL